MMLHIHVRRPALVILAATLLVMSWTVPALAHSELQTPIPADKSTSIEPVAVVSGIFTEAMATNGSSLIVKRLGGAIVAQGSVDPANRKRMVATPAAPLGSGSYVVEWTAVATDGHVERGTWTFAVALTPTRPGTASPTATSTAAGTAATSASPSAVPSGPAPSAGPTTAPSAGPTTAPSAGPTPAPSAGGDTTGSGGDVVLPIVVALIVLGAGAAYLLTRRDRPTSAT